jgi:hypothetical protein
MGATCAQWGPYGSHVHCTGAKWHHLRGKWCHMRLPCTAWEPNAPYGSHMHHMWAIWEPCVHYEMQRAPCGSFVQCAGHGSCVQWIAPYWSHMCCMGATYGSRYNICEEDGIIWGKNATYGGHMEAECAGWELCVPYWR